MKLEQRLTSLETHMGHVLRYALLRPIRLPELLWTRGIDIAELVGGGLFQRSLVGEDQVYNGEYQMRVMGDFRDEIVTVVIAPEAGGAFRIVTAWRGGRRARRAYEAALRR